MNMKILDAHLIACFSIPCLRQSIYGVLSDVMLMLMLMLMSIDTDIDIEDTIDPFGCLSPLGPNYAKHVMCSCIAAMSILSLLRVEKISIVYGRPIQCQSFTMN